MLQENYIKKIIKPLEHELHEYANGTNNGILCCLANLRYRKFKPRFFGLCPQNDNQQQECHSERSEESNLKYRGVRDGLGENIFYIKWLYNLLKRRVIYEE